jgi:hypothetical protein
MVTWGPVRTVTISGLTSLILRAVSISIIRVGVEVYITTMSNPLAISRQSSRVNFCTGASTTRLPSIIPAGKQSQVGYQNEVTSRDA